MADDLEFEERQARVHDARRYWTDGGYATGGVVRHVDYAKEKGGIELSW